MWWGDKSVEWKRPVFMSHVILLHLPSFLRGKHIFVINTCVWFDKDAAHGGGWWETWWAEMRWQLPVQIRRDTKKRRVFFSFFFFPPNLPRSSAKTALFSVFVIKLLELVMNFFLHSSSKVESKLMKSRTSFSRKQTISPIIIWIHYCFN